MRRDHLTLTVSELAHVHGRRYQFIRAPDARVEHPGGQEHLKRVGVGDELREDALGHYPVVHPLDRRRQIHSAPGQAIRHDVIGVTVEAVLVVGDDDRGVHLVKDGGERTSGCIEVDLPERRWPFVLGPTHHP